jgi:hypothetical protein
LVQHAEPALFELDIHLRIDRIRFAIDAFGKPSQPGANRSAPVM